MPDVFLHGRLRHLPLLETVLGTSATALTFAYEDLSDHLAVQDEVGGHVTLYHCAGQTARGIVLSALTEQQIARIGFYTGRSVEERAPVTLPDGRVVFVLRAPEQAPPDAPAWHLDAWQAQEAPVDCAAAEEFMGYFGERSRQAVLGMMPMIRSRAASKVRAGQSLHGHGTRRGRIDIHDRRRAYAHFFALDDFEVQHDRFDGAMSPVLTRAVFIATDAAILLPYDPIRDRVLLVEQMRMGPLARGDRSCWQLEPIAGHIDPGETPQEAARREAVEEAGLSLDLLEEVAQVYASPGNSTEFYYIFCGLADLPDSVAGIGGIASENEDIRSHLLDFNELMTLVDDLQAANAPLVLAAYWLAANRHRLRADA